MSRKNYEKKNSGSNFVNYETEYNLYKPFIVLNLRDILTYKSQFRLYKLFSYIYKYIVKWFLWIYTTNKFSRLADEWI